MRKEVMILGILIISLLFVICNISALACTSNNNCSASQICNITSKQCISGTSQTIATDETSKINNAYTCLKNKIKDKCSSLSSEERVFSLLATGECADDVLSDSKYKTDLKYTAEAVFALDKTTTSTEDAESWLLSQNTTPEDVVWYVQIESNDETTCTITYQPDTTKNTITIDADKKISSNAGACLSLSEGSYWLRVDKSCYDKSFDISCNKGFQTNLLFKKTTSSTIYVSEKTTSASAEGTTTEKVDSVCFSQGNSCSYEGSLWAAMVLDFKGNDVSSYIPYLMTMAEDNTKLLPNAFLYYLIGSGDFRAQILLQQRENKYWDESGDKFYDTAVALLAFQSQEPTQKTNSKNWLLEVQDKDGCWQGNIKNTAFLLSSIWPRSFTIIEPNEDCTASGKYCMSRIDCEGSVLADYDCSGALVCCDTPKTLETCSQLTGKPCASGEICSGGNFEDSSDKGNSCCVSGTCKVEEQQSECQTHSGNCRAFGCNDNEQSTTDYSCTNSQDTCCITKTTTPSGNYTWLWILLILIVLVVIAIIFRDKLRISWFKLKSKFRKGPSYPAGQPRRPGFPPPSSRSPMFQQQPMRRIFPSSPQQQPQMRRPPQQRPPGELDSVLKKLKEMGGK